MQEGWRYTQSTVTINEASRSLRWLLPPRERRGGIAPQGYLGGSFFTMRPACMRHGQLRHRRSGLGDPLDQFRCSCCPWGSALEHRRNAGSPVNTCRRLDVRVRKGRRYATPAKARGRSIAVVRDRRVTRRGM